MTWQRTAQEHIGKTFGRLTIEAVVYYPGAKAAEAHFKCRCTCETHKILPAGRVLRGGVRSCGCLRAPTRDFESKEYRAWLNIKQRCGNPKNPSYRNYGQRGIRIANVWLGSDGFERFLEHVGKAPSSEHSIERIAPKGDYEPGNVRWATSKEQAINKRTSSVRPQTSAPSSLEDKVRAAWKSMRQRCYKENNPAYAFYGGRGIRVCVRWRKSFANFLADMDLPPTRQHTLDRKNPNRNYTPMNCRWATRKEQGTTRRTTILVAHNGRTLCVSEWARRLGINHQTLRYHLFVKGESLRTIQSRMASHHG